MNSSLTSPQSDIAEARARAGKAIRDLGHALVGHHVEIAVIDELTDTLRRHTDALVGGDIRDRVAERPTGDWGPAPEHGAEMFSFDERPISGRSSPYGLDLRVVRDRDTAVGHVTLGSAHEGAPGRSHGGIISALFDDVFGFLLTIEQQPAFTGTLTVRYERGVPLHVPLECRVRFDRRDGRKLHFSGELTGTDDAGEVVVFTRSTAIFIAIAADDFAAQSAK